MNGIAVYLEGGGDTAESKASIRFGMAQFLGALRDAARRKHWHWKVVPCGSRVAARDAFLNARTTDAESHAILLVDSEAPVAGSPTAHLRARDGWILTGVPDDDVHFMAQVMETWIVSGPEALAELKKVHTTRFTMVGHCCRAFERQSSDNVARIASGCFR